MPSHIATDQGLILDQKGTHSGEWNAHANDTVGTMSMKVRLYGYLR